MKDLVESNVVEDDHKECQYVPHQHIFVASFGFRDSVVERAIFLLPQFFPQFFDNILPSFVFPGSLRLGKVSILEIGHVASIHRLSQYKRLKLWHLHHKPTSHSHTGTTLRSSGGRNKGSFVYSWNWAWKKQQKSEFGSLKDVICDYRTDFITFESCLREKKYASSRKTLLQHAIYVNICEYMYIYIYKCTFRLCHAFIHRFYPKIFMSKHEPHKCRRTMWRIGNSGP